MIRSHLFLLPLSLIFLMSTRGSAQVAAEQTSSFVPQQSAYEELLKAQQSPKAQQLETLYRRLRTDEADLRNWSSLARFSLQLARESSDHILFHQAEIGYRRVLSEDPSDADAWMGLAYSHHGRHEFDQALQAAREFARLEPENLQAIALLGDVHFALGNDLEARALYQRLESLEISSESRARMALWWEANGDLEAAQVAFAEAFEAAEMLHRSNRTKAWILSMQGEMERKKLNPKAAENFYQRALQLDPQLHAARSALARIWTVTERTTEAEQALRRLVKDQPQPEHWIHYGNFLVRQNRADEAQQWFALAEEDLIGDLESGVWDHARILVEYWIARNIEAEKAVKVAKYELENVRKDWQTHATLAKALHHAGQSKKAIPYLASAWRGGQADPDFLSVAVEIYRTAGFAGKATQCEILLRSLRNG